MLAKWITFDVDPSEREAFAAAQAAWSGLADARGFVAQVGGWLNAERSAAGVLSIWTDLVRYQLFMRRNQARTGQASPAYVAGRMALASELMRIDGPASTFAAAAQRADVLRISDCAVERPQMAQFIEQQRATWERPADARDFVAGSLMRVQHDEPRFLVASFWQGAPLGRDYSAASLPSFRTNVATQAARETITAQRVHLVDAWRVLAS